MADNIDDIIQLIQQSPLDKTIKDILIRDLKADGLTDFLREQIIAYCVEGRKELKEEYDKALQLLNSKTNANPAQ
jgi:hypothetical protein